MRTEVLQDLDRESAANSKIERGAEANRQHYQSARTSGNRGFNAYT
jgi:hypothetical protein